MYYKGIGIRYIQVLLGLQSSKTTETYTHISRKGIQELGNPLDDFRIFVSEPNNNKNNRLTDKPPNLGVIEIFITDKNTLPVIKRNYETDINLHNDNFNRLFK